MNKDYLNNLLSSLETLNSFDYSSISNCYLNTQNELYRFRTYINYYNLEYIQKYLILSVSFYSELVKKIYNLSVYSQTQEALKKSQDIYTHLEYLFCHINNHSKSEIFKLLDSIDTLTKDFFELISASYKTLFELRQLALNISKNNSSIYINYAYNYVTLGNPKLDYEYGISCIRSSINKLHNSLKQNNKSALYSIIKELYDYDINLHTVLINDNFLQFATPFEISFALKDLILLNKNIVNLNPVKITYGSTLLSTDKSIISLLKDLVSNSKLNLDTNSSVMLDELFASNHFNSPEISATSNNPVFDKMSQVNSEIKSINIQHNDYHSIYEALLINNSFTVLKKIIKAETKPKHYTIFKIAYQNLYNLRSRIPIKIKDFELYTNKWLNF